MGEVQVMAKLLQPHIIVLLHALQENMIRVRIIYMFPRQHVQRPLTENKIHLWPT